jgi:glyoxylase-like metal-dependent hydrolase (beta-lactamase superfamily II)
MGLIVAVGAAAALPGWTRRPRLEHTYFDHARLREGAGAFALLGEGGNSLLFTDGDAALLVDCKNAPFGAVLRADIATLGAGSALTVINSHHHGDHTAGNHAFVGSAAVYAHANAIPRIPANMDWYRAMGEQAARQLRQMPEDKRALAEKAITDYAQRLASLAPENFTPAHAITDPSTTMPIGAASVETHHFGAGHTDNDVVVRLPAHNVVHTGDLVFNRVNPFMDANGGCDPRNWIAVLGKIAGLCDDKTVVVPGHGEVGDRSIITAQAEYIERLIDAVKADLASGLGRDDAVAKTYAFQEGFGFDQGRQVANGFIYDMLSNE